MIECYEPDIYHVYNSKKMHMTHEIHEVEEGIKLLVQVIFGLIYDHSSKVSMLGCQCHLNIGKNGKLFISFYIY